MQDGGGGEDAARRPSPAAGRLTLGRDEHHGVAGPPRVGGAAPQPSQGGRINGPVCRPRPYRRRQPGRPAPSERRRIEQGRPRHPRAQRRLRAALTSAVGWATPATTRLVQPAGAESVLSPEPPSGVADRRPARHQRSKPTPEVRRVIRPASYWASRAMALTSGLGAVQVPRAGSRYVRYPPSVRCASRNAQARSGTGADALASSRITQAVESTSGRVDADHPSSRRGTGPEPRPPHPRPPHPRPPEAHPAARDSTRPAPGPHRHTPSPRRTTGRRRPEVGPPAAGMGHGSECRTASSARSAEPGGPWRRVSRPRPGWGRR